MTEMNADTPATPLTHLPSAVTVKRKRLPFSLVWLIPLVAALIGGWLVVHAILNKGPTITISFRSAEGLEAGRTKIKYRDVNIGTVQKISLAENSKNGVVVTAELDKQAQDFLVKDTRFWVVKPRIVGTGLSGFGTLLSGAYIALEAGHDKASQDDFVGLEVPPVLTSGLAGKSFKLKVTDLGSIDYGTPIYFRRIQVGEVVAYKLDADGQGISVEVFIHAPYDKYVTQNTRFWSDSGLDLSVDSTGIKLATESFASMVFGGLAFADPPSNEVLPPASEGQVYPLFSDRIAAFKQQDLHSEMYQIVFHESVHGLTVGAPVEFRGIPIGEVTNIGVRFDAKEREVTIPVLVRLYPNRLVKKMDNKSEFSDDQRRNGVALLVDNGMRAQLRTGSMITGQLYIALDFFQNVKKVRMDLAQNTPEIPAVTSGLQEIQASITSLASKLDKIPFDQLSGDLHTTIGSLNDAIKGANALIQSLHKDVAPEMLKTLAGAQKTLDRSGKLFSQDSPTQQQLRDTLEEVSRAAKSVRTLTDYLERHPESLIRGKDPKEGSK